MFIVALCNCHAAKLRQKANKNNIKVAEINTVPFEHIQLLQFLNESLFKCLTKMYVIYTYLFNIK